MKELWDKLKLNLRPLIPELDSVLNKGITLTQKISLEQKLGVSLPIDFIEFYQCHNGQSSDHPYIIFCEELLSFERIEFEWSVWQGLLNTNAIKNEPNPHLNFSDAGIKNNHWNSKWIPITYDGSGNHICLDLDPDVGGTYGQIIRFWHDDPVRTLEADSFKGWICNYVDKLSVGEMTYSPLHFGIIEKKLIE